MTLTVMRSEQPAIFDTLMHIQNLVEKHFRDMQVMHYHYRLNVIVITDFLLPIACLPVHQEIEFTIENGVLFLLQSFTAKRTARAAVCVAVSMVKEKIITEREALLRIDPHQMQYFLHPMIDPTYGEQHLTISHYEYIIR